MFEYSVRMEEKKRDFRKVSAEIRAGRLQEHPQLEIRIFAKIFAGQVTPVPPP